MKNNNKNEPLYSEVELTLDQRERKERNTGEKKKHRKEESKRAEEKKRKKNEK